AVASDELPSIGKVTKNGVKYFDFKAGDGPEPQWGQLVSISFVLYARTSPDGQLVKIDSSDANHEPYLFKHGNGRQIKGLEEGLHSMRVGGRRRIVIPPRLGYTVPGLGPFPASPWSRRNLNGMLEKLASRPGSGELVVDVELLTTIDDDADQGYYGDDSLTLEELQEVMRKEEGREAGLSVLSS
ncbi:unnamed protein product, partial [Phaeothamnion confervicola]